MSNTIIQVVIKLANKAPPDNEIILVDDSSVSPELAEKSHTIIVNHNCMDATNPVANKISLPLNEKFFLVSVLR